MCPSNRHSSLTCCSVAALSSCVWHRCSTMFKYEEGVSFLKCRICWLCFLDVGGLFLLPASTQILTGWTFCFTEATGTWHGPRRTPPLPKVKEQGSYIGTCDVWVLGGEVARRGFYALRNSGVMFRVAQVNKIKQGGYVLFGRNR